MVKRPSRLVNPKILLSFAALLVANLIWAGAGPVIKLTIEFIPPFTFLFFRFLLVCILILPFTLVELTKVKIATADAWKIVLLGLFSQSSIILVVFGLKYTTAIDMTIIGSVGVLLAMSVGHYFFNEKMHKGVVFGLILSLCGTVVVILEPILTNGHVNSIPLSLRVWGNILVFLNNLAFLFYIIWSKISLGESTKIIKKTLNFIHIKPLKNAYSSSLLTSISFYVGMLSMLPFALLENFGFFGPVNYNLMSLDNKAIFGLLFMAVFSSIVAYFLFEWALSFVTVGDTAIFGYVSSIFGIPFAFLLLGEVPTAYSLVGAGIIAAGVIVAEVSAHLHKNNKT